jgi:hypothetical protein
LFDSIDNNLSSIKISLIHEGDVNIFYEYIRSIEHLYPENKKILYKRKLTRKKNYFPKSYLFTLIKSSHKIKIMFMNKHLNYFSGIISQKAS